MKLAKGQLLTSGATDDIEGDLLVSIQGKNIFCTGKKWMWVCSALLLCAMPCHAEDVEIDPPLIADLLNEAKVLEYSADNPKNIQRALKLYCKASKLGSLEAEYRIGMLYLSGRGVAKNLTFASSVFSVAAQQGHSQSGDMLKAIKLRPLELPPCLM